MRSRSCFLAVASLCLSAAVLSCSDGAVAPSSPTEPPTPTAPEPPRPARVTITPTTLALSSLGATAQLRAVVVDQHGQTMSGVAVRWSSSDTLVARVDGSGLVTAVAEGGTSIAAAVDSVTGQASVQVEQRVAAVRVSPEAATLGVGDTLRLSAEAVDAGGSPVSGREIRWTSADTLVATVDGSGLVTAAAEGATSIVAAVDSVTGPASVQVERRVAAVRVSPANATLNAGDTLRLSADALDANGSPIPGKQVRWTSADTLVATVDGSGLVAAVAEGGTSIMAEVDSVRGVATVQVERRIAAVRVAPEAATLSAGDTLRLSVEVVDAHGSPIPGKEIRWSSSDTAVAWVDSDGLAFGWREGRATVSAAAGLGDFAGSAEVTLEGEISQDRLALSRLYFRLGGRHWWRSDGWLTDAPLEDWSGVQMAQNRVRGLSLPGNGMVGRLGDELGLLTELWRLDLSANLIWGALPPELAKLQRLEVLYMSDAAISEIPPELGKMAALWLLDLENNDLMGGVPDAIWNLQSLTKLQLGDNSLSGPLSPRIADLPHLNHLDLSGNEISGPIPAEIGESSRLETLDLADNRLTGTLPSGLGDLRRLSDLDLSDNAELSGRLPVIWAARDRGPTVDVSGTEVCAPQALRDWRSKNELHLIPLCSGEDGAFAYLVQTTQSEKYPAPIIAGEDALLRVFLTADSGGANLPPIRARFYSGARLAHSVELPGSSVPIPTEVDEGNLSRSANARIPGKVLQPGLEMVIEIDPASTLDPALGIPKRIPEEGRAPVDIRQVPLLELTAIPFLYTENPDSTVLEYANDLNTETGVFRKAAALLPIVDIDVAIHDPVWTTSRFVADMLRETEAIRVLEGRAGYYMGLMTRVDGGVQGQASYFGSPTFVSHVDPVTIAHELGHSMSLMHTKCGDPPPARPDEKYPWADGSIGAWGYDFAAEEVIPPHASDVMGYCGLNWISTYHIGKALRHRVEVEVTWGADAAETAPSLLVWGGKNPDGQPFLMPSFRVDAPTVLPAVGGDHRVIGYGTDDEALFSLSFAMPETAHLDGASSFVFAVPTAPHSHGALERIVLTGPGGMATLDRGTDRPMSILLDPATGRVRGFLEAPPFQAMAADGARLLPRWSGLEILTSRGIPKLQQP